jgi:uncharacterized membrane protein
MKKILICVVILIVTLSGCAPQSAAHDTYKAKVINVVDESYRDEAAGKFYCTQDLTLTLLEGDHQGETHEAQVYIDAANNTNIALYRTGDTVEVFVALTETGDVDYVSVHTLVRAPYVIALAVVFLILILVMGRLKGLKTILALVFTVSAVIFILVPLIASGYNPVVAAALVCIVITIVTMLAVGGFNRKALSAILGTTGGLVCAAVITLIFSSLMRITGIDTSEVELLMVAETNVIFDYQGILTAGILIGCIGAVMDVGMSISSSLSEMRSIDPAIDPNRLFHSGMAVGRDIIGTMANTLILAYTGGSIMLMVVWSVYGVSFADMLNKGFIVLEIAKSLCGSIGMVMTIPITAFIASRLIAMRPEIPSDIEKEQMPAQQENE